MLGACSGKVVGTELPETITRAAILELEQGIVVAASPLQTIDAAHPLWIEKSDRDAMIVGFDEQTLGAVPASAATEAVSVAGPCAPPFPSPSWVARVRGGALDANAITEVDKSEAPPLTAPWIQERCVVPQSFDIDLRCDEPRCVMAERSPTACTHELDTTGCALGTVELSYSGSSLRCLELRDSSWHCDQDAAHPDRSVFFCGPDNDESHCTVELIAKEKDELPELDTARVHFGALPAAHPDFPPLMHPHIPRSVFEWGQAFELVALRDRVVLTGIAGTKREPCPVGQDRQFVFIDPERVEVTGTATAPRCLERIVRDGEEFVGGFKGENGEPMLGRFDRDGRLLHAASVASGPRAQTLQVVTLDKLGDGFVALLDEVPAPGIEVSSDIIFVRPDLSVSGRFTGSSFEYGLTALPPDRAAVWTHGGPAGSNVLLLASDGSISEMSAIPLIGGYRPTTSRSLGDRLTVFAVDDKEVATFSLSPLTPLSLTGPVGFIGYVISTAVWIDDATFIGGGATGDVTAGYHPEIFFFDPEDGRFLAGRRMIDGLGPITTVRADDQGRFWMLLPWDGDVLRVSARRPR